MIYISILLLYIVIRRFILSRPIMHKIYMRYRLLTSINDCIIYYNVTNDL